MYLALVACMWIGGCATSPITATQSTRSEIIDYPEVDLMVTRALGERLVAKGVRVTGPALEVTRVTQFGKQEGEASVMTCALTVIPSTYFKRGVYSTDSIQADCFGPVSAQLTLADGTTNWNCNGKMSIADICVDRENRYFLASVASRMYLEQDFQNIHLITGIMNSPTNFVQEFIYNGRIGNDLRFVYREFSNDIIRPAFIQEVQYDYSESKIIGFKNLRLEVIDATNIEVTYRVISNF